MSYTFEQALKSFKTEVKTKHPPGVIQTRRVQELTKGSGGCKRGRDSGRYAGRGRFIRGIGDSGYDGGNYYRP